MALILMTVMATISSGPAAKLRPATDRAQGC